MTEDMMSLFDRLDKARPAPKPMTGGDFELELGPALVFECLLSGALFDLEFEIWAVGVGWHWDLLSWGRTVAG